MKTVLVIVCLFLIFWQIECKSTEGAASKVSEDTFTSTEVLCLEELKLNPARIANLNNKNFVPDGNLKYASFIGCFWEKLGWLDSEGKVNFTRMKEDIEEIYEEDSSSSENLESFELTDEEKRIELKIIISAVEKCEYNPPPVGITHGQTALRVRNCISSVLERMEMKGQF